MDGALDGKSAVGKCIQSQIITRPHSSYILSFLARRFYINRVKPLTK